MRQNVCRTTTQSARLPPPDLKASGSAHESSDPAPVVWKEDHQDGGDEGPAGAGLEPPDLTASGVARAS
jgi:hypothetical protein